MINKWDTRFIELTKLIATWSKDPSTKVGAVIVDRQQRIVSTGFNGFPRGIDDELDCERNIKLMRTIHAEENALLFCKQDVTGMSIYCTHQPCAKCAAKIIQSGITRVIYPQSGMLSDKWVEEVKQAKLMFDDVGMIITMVNK